MDHIAHVDGLDGQAFHLTDPEPLTVGQLTNVFAKAAGAPSVAVRLDTKLLDRIPVPRLPVIGRVADLVLAELGIPRQTLHYLNYPTRFDSTKRPERAGRQRIPGAADIQLCCASLGVLGAHVQPDHRKNRALARAVQDKVVLITGASSGIGRATALKVGAAGGTGAARRRTPEKLEQTGRRRSVGPARPTCTAATWPTWPTSSGWPRTRSNSTAGSTS